MNPAFDEPFLPAPLQPGPDADHGDPTPYIPLRDHLSVIDGNRAYISQLERACNEKDEYIAILKDGAKRDGSEIRRLRAELGTAKAKLNLINEGKYSAAAMMDFSRGINKAEPESPVLLLHPDIYDELQCQNCLPDYAIRSQLATESAGKQEKMADPSPSGQPPNSTRKSLFGQYQSFIDPPCRLPVPEPTIKVPDWLKFDDKNFGVIKIHPRED